MGIETNYVTELRTKYNTLYYKIAECFNEMSSYDVKRFSDGNCYYKSNINTLKSLVDMLDDYSINKPSKRNLLAFIKPSPNTKPIEEYVHKYSDSLKQLENCTNCACFKCIKDCVFNPCAECKLGSYIHSCDRVYSNTRVFNNYNIPLINNDNGRESIYNVLCVIELGVDDDKYIFLVNTLNKEDKLVLKYLPTIRGIEYGEITNVNIFDKLVSIYKDSAV